LMISLDISSSMVRRRTAAFLIPGISSVSI
jgi:hypothetical protein